MPVVARSLGSSWTSKHLQAVKMHGQGGAGADLDWDEVIVGQEGVGVRVEFGAYGAGVASEGETGVTVFLCGVFGWG